MGTTEIEVEIGAQGQLQDSWVRWSSETDSSNMLSDAALAAARKSTYEPPTVDGRPAARRYRILYTFVIYDLAKPLSFPASDEFDLCPLVIDRIATQGPSTADPNGWYFLSLTASRDDIASAVIGLRDRQGSATGYPWSRLVLTARAGLRKRWSAKATFNFGAAIDESWIDSVVLADGKTYSCPPIIQKPETETAVHPRTLVGAPLPLLAVQSPVTPDFTTQAWPDYPYGADGKRAAGQVSVESVVDDSGRVLDGFVTRSSGRNELDLAALAAAQASRYVPAEKGGIKVYDETYRFVL